MEKMTAVLDNGTYLKALAEYSPRPIHDDVENARATALLEQIDALENPTPEQIAVAEVLMTLIEAYELNYTLERASGVELLRELMAANDLKQKDLEVVLKSKGMVSDLLHGRRPISKGVARKLSARFNVSYTLFL
jgi:HTH-type transcriptional regulator/antitoxin HigA